jgi:transcriptional regulator with XRE-family HTH domain
MSVAAEREHPGARARRIRERKKLTIKQVAQGAGLGVGAVCDFENGKRVLRVDSLVKLAAFLGVQPGRLLDA